MIPVPKQDSSSTITRVSAPWRPPKPPEAQETSSPSCARKSHSTQAPSTYPSNSSRSSTRVMTLSRGIHEDASTGTFDHPFDLPFELEQVIDQGHDSQSGSPRGRINRYLRSPLRPYLRLAPSTSTGPSTWVMAIDQGRHNTGLSTSTH